MKVDMDKLGALNKKPAGGASPYKNLWKKAACLMGCLALFGAVTIFRQAAHNDSVSADALYDASEANPSFTVQHVGDMGKIDIQPGEGPVTVLSDGSDSYHVNVNEDGTLQEATATVTLFEDYETDWLHTDTIGAMSFFTGEGGEPVGGYRLKEAWFGRDADSENRSDFLVLQVDEGNLSKVTLTNNPEHPGLSAAAGGYYVENEGGGYVICLQDKDVVRLVFEPEGSWEYDDVDVYDYDVSDGGYYRKGDKDNKGEQYATSGQESETGPIYVDAVESGVHAPGNYSGDGPKLAFGADGIGTKLAEESLADGLDTINVWNYGQQEAAGVTKGLAKGVGKDGSLLWNDNIAGLNLFGGRIEGRTDYNRDEYSFTFRRNGFSRTLSAVESEYGTAAENLERIREPFWILDWAPSFGTDGHDPAWGSGSEDVLHYRGDGGEPEAFAASDDEEDHNSFFGFSYTEDFTISPGYCGPLSFFGYSDDDLWAFAGQVDKQGNVLEDTVVQVADLGGVHDRAAYYCDMWDVIDKVPYGEESRDWRLFVYWLEREGTSADCYLNFSLPEAIGAEGKETASVTVEASEYGSVRGADRTFVLDDGTHDRYQGIYNDGTKATIVSGQEFTIPGGSFVSIEGLKPGKAFTVKEAGRASIWSSLGDGYTEGDTAKGTAGINKWVSFLSAEEKGTLSVGIDAGGSPTDGYQVKLMLDNAGGAEVLAMDGHNNPLGSRFLDEEGALALTLAAGETVKLYNLPEGMGFTLEPGTAPGWHISEILLDNGDVSGFAVTGTLPAHVVYRYEENEIKAPLVAMEQSVGSGWGTSDILLGNGALLSYKITVENPNDVPMDIIVEDKLPDGVMVMETSLPEGVVTDGQTMRWDVSLDAGGSAEIAFTCQVSVEGACELVNSAQAMASNEVVSSNSVKAVVP